MQDINILIVGVGGQGTLLASRVLGALALNADLDVKVSEVHGMAQRGGSVVTHVRIGQYIASPMIDVGGADFILGFERLEAARALPFLKPGGAMLVNSQQIPPMPVILGNEPYPEGLEQMLKEESGRFMRVDALSLAQKAGNAKCVNTVMMGLLSTQLPFTQEDWQSALQAAIPAKLLDINLTAFELGKKQTD